MGFNHVLQMIQFIFLTLLVLTVASTSNFTIAKPGCDDHCGDVSIPFPFGMRMTPECYPSHEFLVTCNQTFTPPKPFLQDSNVEITDISLDGQLTLLNYIAHDCYNSIGKQVSRGRSRLRMGGTFFTVNSTANKFTIIGCDAYGYFFGDRLNHTYKSQTGCMAMCGALDDMVEGNCTGTGCCHIPIPDDVLSMNLTLYSFKNYTRIKDGSRCSYAFVVKESAYTFSLENLTNSMDVRTRMPMVIDWAIGYETCEEARLDASSYACKAVNATCLNKHSNGYGYRCYCQEGYQGNPYLTNGCQDVNECEDQNLNDCMDKYCVNTPGSFNCTCPEGYHGDGKKDGKGKGCIPDDQSLVYKLAAGIALGVIFLLLAALWFHVELKRRRLIKMRENFFIQNGGKLLQEKLNGRESSSSYMKMIYNEFELQKATDNFNNNRIIGKGGFGTVYKGSLGNKITVAIKKPIAVDTEQKEQFINELMVLLQINHRNVVKLLGCCLETKEPLLVYEFISNGTLYEHVHNKAKASSLSWDMRLKIASETAGVLWYLHSSASTPIIHRDVKSANILLDGTHTAKVSDFGSSKLVPWDQTHVATMVQGTLGYLDPEYMQTNQLTEKSDVYSFGVVLIELLTGKMVLRCDGPEEERSLAKLFLSVMKQNRLFEILDDNVASEENKERVMKVAELARSCLNVKGDDRPSMKEVAMELEGLRVGVKHSWVQSENNAEDMDFSIGDGFSSITNSYGLSIGFDSLNDATTLPVDGGR